MMARLESALLAREIARRRSVRNKAKNRIRSLTFVTRRTETAVCAWREARPCGPNLPSKPARLADGLGRKSRPPERSRARICPGPVSRTVGSPVRRRLPPPIRLRKSYRKTGGFSRGAGTAQTTPGRSVSFVTFVRIAASSFSDGRRKTRQPISRIEKLS